MPIPPTKVESQVKVYVPTTISLHAGDSVQNILGDVLSCALGYILGTLFLALDLWWLSLVWVAVSEVKKFHEISLTALVHGVQTAATLWIQMVLSPALKENNQNAMVA